MGRGGYNGGSPAVTSPKKDNVYIFESEGRVVEIFQTSQILEAGLGLRNELGGVQAEFGYIIVAATAEDAPSIPSLWLFLRRQQKREEKGKKGKEKIPYRWIAASTLLKHAPELARKYHQEYPTAQKPHGFVS
jgi:hypothetical protein